jgi:hypothetical protein
MGQVDTTFQVIDQIPSSGQPSCGADWRGGQPVRWKTRHESVRTHLKLPLPGYAAWKGMALMADARRHLARRTARSLLACHLFGDGSAEKVRGDCGNP